MRALRIYAGPKALRVLREGGGLRPEQVAAVPAAAGGPKGLMLLRMDEFLFGHWLPQTQRPVQLVGASIGAWRMATACLDDPVAAFQCLAHDYIHQDFQPLPGKKRPTAEQVSTAFAQSLELFYGGRVQEVLQHPRWHLHVVVSQGQDGLRREHPWQTPLGYAAAWLANAVDRRYLGRWLQRGVFSVRPDDGLPMRPDGMPTQQWALTAENFMPAVRASCSIPFAMQAVHDIPGAPAGAYWDGGITDYHVHWAFKTQADEVVLYPHFQKAVVPGWLDKAWKSRHVATSALDNMVVLAPDPAWVKALPNGKLPDRHDFVHYADDFKGRVAAWSQAVAASQQLVDEWSDWLQQPRPDAIEPL